MKYTKPADAHQAKQIIILADENECFSASSPLLCQLQLSRVRSFTHCLKLTSMQRQGKGSRVEEAWLMLHSCLAHTGLRNMCSKQA